jgi:hypothetical protein
VWSEVHIRLGGDAVFGLRADLGRECVGFGAEGGIAMLFYSQTKGQFTNDSGAVVIDGCYAGRDVPNGFYGKNNPVCQAAHDIGPLPQGQYTISPLHAIPHLGPAMALTPAPDNEMFARSGFFIHLDNPIHIGASSDGCIVCAGDPNGPLAGYQKQAKLEALRCGGEDQLTVTA